ncbi:MAG: hypothetical protein EXQ90_01485 [Rhodospirillales bacterium]|nr:hypothetical protein [Rhodospirillales bacterium]
MDPHIVKAFDEELRRLDDKIAEMGGRAEAQLADAVAALVKRDPRCAAILVARDREIDDL